MTLLLIDGFTNVDSALKPEWTGGGLTPVAGRDATANGAAQIPNDRTINVPASTGIVVGCAHKVTGGDTSSCLFWVNSGFCVTWSSGFLQIRNGNEQGTILATSAVAYPYNAWNYVELKLTGLGASKTATVRQNGVTVISYTGTINGSGSITTLRHLAYGGITQQMDDFYACDLVDATATQGRANNDFLGDIKILALRPSAPGDSTDFTPTSSPNWGCVDENPLNTTDYVSSPTAAARDLYNVPDLPLGAGDVFGIRQMVYTSKSDAGVIGVKPITKTPDGAVAASTSVAPTLAWAATWAAMRATRTGTTPYVKSDIDGLQVGVEIG